MEKKENLHANHRQRLKRRALAEGLDSFEPHNVLELMLFYALPHVDTNDIAHELINRFGSFDAVFDAPIEELVKVKGIKEQAATFIKLMPELCRYYYCNNSEYFQKKPDYKEIGVMFTKYFIGRHEESVACMFFDSDGTYISTKTIFTGSIESVGFSLRPILDEAIKCGAYKIAMAHNHPSHITVPSVHDIDSTERLKVSLKQMNIDLVEHFIVCKDVYLGILVFIEEKLKGKAQP